MLLSMISDSLTSLLFDEDYRLLLHGIVAALLAILAFPTLVWVREQVIVMRTPQPPIIDWETKLSSSSNGNTSDTVHLIVLVHGLQNTPWSLKGFKASLESQAASKNSGGVVVVHSSNSCVGKTTKGVMLCGRLVAQEINDILSSLMVHIEHHQSQRPPIRKVTLSLYGNSLGGLMARASMPHIQWNYQLFNNNLEEMKKVKITIQPNIFCTTSSPHLGSRGSLIFYMPKFAQYFVAICYGKSMKDLLRYNNTMEILQSDTYLRVLGRFHKRISYSTAHQTDFQVPTMTATFLTQTKSLHRVLSEFTTTPSGGGGGNPIPFLIQAYSTHKATTSLTASTSSGSSSDGTNSFDDDNDDDFEEIIDTSSTNKTPLLLLEKEEADDDAAPTSTLSDQEWIDHHGSRLDRLGWIKVFCDFRPHLFSIPTCCGGSRGGDQEDIGLSSSSSPSSTSSNKKTPWITSLQLRRMYCTPTPGRWYAPLAHTVVTGMLAGFWSNNTIIHALAERLLQDILEQELQPQEES